LNETIFTSPIGKKDNWGKMQNLRRKFMDNKNFGKTSDGNKIKNYSDKLTTRRNFLKTESEKMANLRNTFMTTFNENISKEENLYNELVNKFEAINLDSYCETYRNLIKTNEKISPTLIDIKNMLSLRKDQMITLALGKKQIKTFLEAQSYYDDILTNDWKVSQKTLEALIKIINQ